MAEVEKRVMVELERYSPEGLLKAWMTPLNADWMQEMLKKSKNRAAYPEEQTEQQW